MQKQRKELELNTDLKTSLGFQKNSWMDEQQKEGSATISDDNVDLKSFDSKSRNFIGGAVDANIEKLNLNVDFLQAKKKKTRNKMTQLDKLLAVNNDEEKRKPTFIETDRDYTYDELLRLVFETILEQNPAVTTARKLKLKVRPPQLLRVGTKKTAFINFMDVAKTLHRTQQHLMKFLLAELGTNGSIDGNQQLIIKGRFERKQIENVLRRYIKEYVTCPICNSTETLLQKDKRLCFIQCECCSCRCSVADIQSGYQAATSKRAALRMKKNLNLRHQL